MVNKRVPVATMDTTAYEDVQYTDQPLTHRQNVDCYAERVMITSTLSDAYLIKVSTVYNDVDCYAERVMITSTLSDAYLIKVREHSQMTSSS